MTHVNQSSKEKELSGSINGWSTLFGGIFLFLFSVYQGYEITAGGNASTQWLSILFYVVIGIIVPLVICSGNVTLEPNEGIVYSFAGNYIGTLKRPGYYTMPFWWRNTSERVLSTKTIKIEPITVNEHGGNPIIIGCEIFCREKDTYAATYEISELDTYLESKGEIALRKLAMQHPMDTIETDKTSLRGNSDEIIKELEKEITQAFAVAGYEVESAALNTLQYSPEIAGAMLQRQQAKATVEARETITKGALGIVDDTLKHLTDKNIEFNGEAKQKLVTSLLTVLCSNHSVSPVLEV